MAMWGDCPLPASGCDAEGEAQGTGGSQLLPRLTLTRHSPSTWVMFYLEVELSVSSVFYKHPEDVLSCPFCSADPLRKNQCVHLAGRAV